METSDVGKWLQRDVNCLADPQRSVRKRSLEKLSMVAELAAKFGQGHLVSFFQSHLFEPLVRCFADPIEKNRELSIRTCTEYAKLGAIAGDGREKALVVAIHARIGKAPFPEGAEELRLQLLELLALVLHGAMPEDSTFTTSIGDVMETLAKTATDPFPDAKKACCDAILVLAAKWPAQVKMHLATLARPLTMNLSHQHARIRLCTLQALEVVVPCGSTTLPELMKDVLLPNLSRVMFDRSAAVRKQLVQAMATWCLRIDELRAFEAALLPLFLSGLADESPEVQIHSLVLLEQLSTLWVSDPLHAEHDDVDESMAAVVTPPFTARPPLGARLVTRRLLAQLLPSLLDQCADWTVQTRERATSILRVVLVLAEDAADAHVAAILAALAKTCRDDEPVVVTSVQSAMAVVGHFANPDLIFSSLLPLAAGRLPGQDTSHHRTNGLVLLSMAIAGMAQPTILPHMERITEALADAGLREADAPELQEKLSLLTATIVTTGAPLLATHDSWGFRLFWVLSQMIASTPEDSTAFDTATNGLLALATALQLDVPGLYLRFLSPLVETISAKNAVWSKASPHRVLFDSLARRGGKACGAALPVLLPVLLRHLDPARDADVRLAFLALLETMLGNPEMAPAFQPFASTLLVKAITPNIVWQGGKVAATIRKVAMACTYTLLRQGLATTPCLFEAAPVMLPVLKAALDDGDAKTRQLVCLALQFLFVALPNALGQEPVAQLYHDLLKRLDDSNDLVRKAACATFVEFLRAAPTAHFHGTIIDYSMDALFVHLDDNDSEVQAAVFAVLLETKRIDATRLRQKANENRSRLRSPFYCDQLLL